MENSIKIVDQLTKFFEERHSFVKACVELKDYERLALEIAWIIGKREVYIAKELRNGNVEKEDENSTMGETEITRDPDGCVGFGWNEEK